MEKHFERNNLVNYYYNIKLTRKSAYWTGYTKDKNENFYLQGRERKK